MKENKQTGQTGSKQEGGREPLAEEDNRDAEKSERQLKDDSIPFS